MMHGELINGLIGQFQNKTRVEALAGNRKRVNSNIHTTTGLEVVGSNNITWRQNQGKLTSIHGK